MSLQSLTKILPLLQFNMRKVVAESYKKLLIFGGGYVGQAFCDAIKDDFDDVIVTKRQPQAHHEITFNDGQPLPPALFQSVTHVLSTIPPSDKGDPVLQLHRDDLVQSSNLLWVGYLSSTSIYGDHQGRWVDETTLPQPQTATAMHRYAAEQSWQDLWNQDIPVHIFRLSGIYGPGRSVFEALHQGRAQVIHKADHVFNHIHVDDIVQVLKASLRQPSNHRPLYNLADDLPSASLDVYRFAVDLMNRELPRVMNYGEAILTPRMQEFYQSCRRVANRRIKDELAVNLIYPTYKQGLTKIWAQLNTTE